MVTMRREGRVHAFAREEHAASMVEFAVVAPVLLVFMFGIVDFGRALFVYNNMQDAARRAARLAAVQPSPNPCASSATVRDSVSAWVRDFSNVTPQYTLNMRCVNAAGNDATTDVTDVKVTISGYQFQPLIPLPAWGLRALTFAKSAGSRFEGAPDGS
ncbi:hypothetical protein tb265_16110 [Gemmatimonadetes bacterium T265]|nr:hypothetical protein tb265_16110 [Gemmatimonadetes bacterium T265]